MLSMLFRRNKMNIAAGQYIPLKTCECFIAVISCCVPTDRCKLVTCLD